MEKEISKNTKQDNPTSYKNLKIIDINEIEGSTFKTKKKSFVSDINPHVIRRNIQKEQYIWFGVYDGLLRNKNLISYIKKCKDNSLPLECAAIHLEKYSISFCKASNSEVKAFLFENEGSVVFLKLYLITKSQLVDIMTHCYQINLPQESTEEIFNILNKPEASLDLTMLINNNNLSNSSCNYKMMKCLGELDSILIYSLTTNKSLKSMELAAPDTDYLRNIYLGLKKSFSPYSEFLLMYYVYRLDGVRNFYTINQLKECFFKNKTNNTSLESKGINEINLNIENLNLRENTVNTANINLINTGTANNSPRRDNETVKCSTCNASPFVTTPEKDHLNQYSYIFDLHHLPIFDENTGEFFWSNNEANWKKARDSILRSEELGVYNGKSISINHGSLMSLSREGSFLMGNNKDYPLNTLNFQTNPNYTNTEGNYTANKTEEDFNQYTWAKFKNDGASNTFIEELNNLLKDFEK
jgi:hypothetical protein